MPRLWTNFTKITEIIKSFYVDNCTVCPSNYDSVSQIIANYWVLDKFTAKLHSDNASNDQVWGVVSTDRTDS